jgi:DNA-binding Lrp family transcriptional regulator
MEFPRLPRFKRVPPAAPIDLTDRDHEIIRLVQSHRFLRSSRIVSLLGGSPQQIVRRLQMLYHSGYLERPRAQLNYYHKPGSREIVYGLGDKGAALLSKEENIASRELHWSEKNRSVERPYLEHALMVSDVMVALELACRRANVRFLTEADLLVRKKEEGFRWRVNIDSNVRLGVIPDRAFALEFQKHDGKTERAYFFLEADRGTMPVIRNSLSQTSFYRKLLAYEATWLQSIHTKRYGFHRFRVLTVTTSAARAQSLTVACTQLKQGHRLFLFTDKSILEKPGEILFHIFRTGRTGETSTLLNIGPHLGV